MYGLLIGFGVGLAFFAGVIALGFPPWAAIIPATIGFLAANYLLARRIGKLMQGLSAEVQKEIAAQRIDKGIKLLESGFRYEKWQFMLAGELHANIGVLHYMKKEFDAARPHLEKSSKRGPSGARAHAMLACLEFMKKNEEAMTSFFETAVKADKKESIIWAVYAWCLNRLGKRDEALKVMIRATETNPVDEKLKSNLVALQNEKKLKMKAYSFEWYQFHLEKPPVDGGPAGGGRRKVIFQRR